MYPTQAKSFPEDLGVQAFAQGHPLTRIRLRMPHICYHLLCEDLPATQPLKEGSSLCSQDPAMPTTASFFYIYSLVCVLSAGMLKYKLETGACIPYSGSPIAPCKTILYSVALSKRLINGRKVRSWDR